MTIAFGQSVAQGKSAFSPVSGDDTVNFGIATDVGHVRVSISKIGDVQVTQGGMITQLPFARPV